ncbi:MAG: Vacuolar protein sorting-associated protein 20 [Geoglossum umbratile]|nr:MAG: Vacuolar protein sorting-associated protein 20 [Geoglossum umbratile]
MKLQRDKLRQYQKRITILTTRETAIARDLLSRGDRSRALLALRRKKYQETLLSRTDAQLSTLEQLTQDVEFALVQKDVLFGIEQGTKVLKEIQREMGGLEGVEKLLEETEEARAYQREVSEMLGGRMSNQDEDEVEDELEALEKEATDPLPTPQLQQSQLPSAPTTDLPTLSSEDLERSKAEARRTRARERAKAAAAEPMLA